MLLGNPMLEIALVSLVMVIVSQLLQRKFLDRKAMKQMQEDMKEKQKKLRELMEKDDQKSKAEAERLQSDMMEQMSKSMQGTMKHMVVSLPIFFAVYFVLGTLYSGNLIQLPFALPVIHRDFSFEVTAGISWIWWYIYTSITLSIILNIGMKIAEKRSGGK